MRRFKNFNEEDWSQMGDRSKDWTRRQYQKAVAAGDKERAKDFIDTYGKGVTLKVGHGQDAQGKEIGKFGEPAFKKRVDKIKKDKTEAVEVNEIIGTPRIPSAGQDSSGIRKATGADNKAPATGQAKDSKVVTIQKKIEFMIKQKAAHMDAAAKHHERSSDFHDRGDDDSGERAAEMADDQEDKARSLKYKIEDLKDELAQAKLAYNKKTGRNKQEESVELDDISVGKKKKVPAGIKVDPTVKGYAYNEKDFKPHMMYDPKTGKAYKAEKPEDHVRMSKLGYTHEKPEVKEGMSLDDIKKKYAKEIIAFQDGGSDLSGGAKMAIMGYADSDSVKTDDPDELDKFVMGLQMGKYKKTEEQVNMDILLTMLEETNLDEALSPKEKEKRLAMIKKAVEKLNRANIEKVKKMAMRDMKAAGMFDDAIEEKVGDVSFYDRRKAFEKKILDIKQQVARGEYKGKVDKNGNPVITADGMPYTVKLHGDN